MANRRTSKTRTGAALAASWIVAGLAGSVNEGVRSRPGDMVFIRRSKMGNVRRLMEAARVGLYFTPFGLL